MVHSRAEDETDEKQIRTVAVGCVRLSDPVERFLPEVKQLAAKPAGAAPFTFLQLATMTAGLAREPQQAGPFWTGPVSAWEKTLFSALPSHSIHLRARDGIFVLQHRLRDPWRCARARGESTVCRVGARAHPETARHESHAVRDRSGHRVRCRCRIRSWRQ